MLKISQDQTVLMISSGGMNINIVEIKCSLQSNVSSKFHIEIWDGLLSHRLIVKRYTIANSSPRFDSLILKSCYNNPTFKLKMLHIKMTFICAITIIITTYKSFLYLRWLIFSDNLIGQHIKYIFRTWQMIIILILIITTRSFKSMAVIMLFVIDVGIMN